MSDEVTSQRVNICVIRENVAGHMSLRATVRSEAIPSVAGWRLLRRSASSQ